MTSNLTTDRDLDGRVAVVTGASRGVGAAIAQRFAEAGAKVGLLSRSGDDLGLGDDALGVACDVSDRSQVFGAIENVVSKFGSLDCVVANAGVGMYGNFLDLDPDDVETMIDVNLKGTLYTAAATLPHLIAAGGGDFVSLASVAGLRAFPGETVYNASKFGQVGFTRSLDHELREHGVRATNLCPGGIATDFAMGKGREEGSTEGMLSADEVAETVVYCVTRPSNWRMLTMSYRPMIEGSWG
ncbi:MAG TPA: SDR family oxidoreductase [Thermoleophilaceae bacterium]|nr:SDR family oxidoreductase [Thermoleophilaceae bacterium]